MQNRIRQITEHIMNDKSLSERLAAARNLEERVPLIVEAAGSAGFSVSSGEVKAHLERGMDNELSDAHLEAVVGGKNYGTFGDDYMKSSSNMGDAMWGFTGNDTMDGRGGHDSMSGGFGEDVMDGGAGNDTMTGGFGSDSMDGGDGNDLMLGGTAEDTMFGGAGDDTIKGGIGDDDMDGGMGNDTMYGGWGADTLSGGAGDDSMDGGLGDDVMASGVGDDTLTGGWGNDVFFFDVKSGEDTITDFTLGEDSIQLDGVADPGDFTVSYSDGNTVIKYGDSQITVENTELTAEQIMDMQT